MGYGTDGLTFRTLRDGNIKRLPLFKTKDGKPAHTKPDGSDWPPASWLQAVVGELGEYANLRKKVERGDITLEKARPKLASELADVVIYLDLLAYRLGINLGEAVMKTWNDKAAALDIPMYLDAEDWHYTRILTDEEKRRYEFPVRLCPAKLEKNNKNCPYAEAGCPVHSFAGTSCPDCHDDCIPWVTDGIQCGKGN